MEKGWASTATDVPDSLFPPFVVQLGNSESKRIPFFPSSSGTTVGSAGKRTGGRRQKCCLLP